MKLTLCLISILFEVHCLEFVDKEFQRPHLQVKTEGGIVQGIRLPSKSLKKGSYHAFLGIPYAEPPVGELRFESPKWAANWSGVLDASRQGSSCVEVMLEIALGTSSVTGNEDCLFLNVYINTNPSKTKKLKPVMVFLHGGGYIFGSSDIKFYGPDLLVSKDVLVVTLNYRLGVFGFLSTEDLASPGNYGLKDQNLALRWIQKNIKYFGGDPDSVTLFGQSAGSTSVHFHMLSPKSRGLFHKAILESGSALCLWGGQRKPRNVAYLVGLANGITNPRDSEELVRKLRQIDLEDMKQTLLAVAISATAQALFTGLPFAPSLEDDHEDAFLTKNNWYEMLENGKFNHVPTIMGMNSNETLLFLQEATILKPLLVLFDLDTSLITPVAMNITDNKLSMTVGGLIRDRFFGKNNRIVSSDVLDVARYINWDFYVRPIWKTAELMSRHIPLYFYYFRYESELGRFGLGPGREYPGVRGVLHAEEVFFIFNKLNNASKRKADYLVRERLITMWTNFAKYSNPTPTMGNGNDSLEGIVWPTFTARNNSQTFLEIDKVMKIRTDFGDYENVLWWNELFDKYGNPPFHTY